jgi:hypothetical protein
MWEVSMEPHRRQGRYGDVGKLKGMRDREEGQRRTN